MLLKGNEVNSLSVSDEQKEVESQQNTGALGGNEVAEGGEERQERCEAR